MPTPYPTAPAVLAAARTQLGHTEAPAGSNLTPYGAWYGMNPAPWCGIFAGWAFAHAVDGLDLRDVGISPAYVPAFHDQATARGWARVSPAELRAGDVAFLGFTHAGDYLQHVGIVAGVLPGIARTVEGNTTAGDAGVQANGGGVYQRERALGLVRAALRPPYASAGGGGGSDAGVTIRRALRLASPYLVGDDVRAVQHLVRASEDGVYGPRTVANVKLWQRAHGIAPDGVFGPESTAAAGWRWSLAPAH